MPPKKQPVQADPDPLLIDGPDFEGVLTGYTLTKTGVATCDVTLTFADVPFEVADWLAMRARYRFEMIEPAPTVV